MTGRGIDPRMETSGLKSLTMSLPKERRPTQLANKTTAF